MEIAWREITGYLSVSNRHPGCSLIRFGPLTSKSGFATYLETLLETPPVRESPLSNWQDND